MTLFSFSVLGNHAMIEDVLKIVSGVVDEEGMEDRFESEILGIVGRVELPGGLDTGGWF